MVIIICKTYDIVALLQYTRNYNVRELCGSKIKLKGKELSKNKNNQIIAVTLEVCNYTYLLVGSNTIIHVLYYEP